MRHSISNLLCNRTPWPSRSYPTGGPERNRCCNCRLSTVDPLCGSAAITYCWCTLECPFGRGAHADAPTWGVSVRPRGLFVKSMSVRGGAQPSTPRDAAATIPQQVWHFSVQCEGARSARPSKARHRVRTGTCLGRDSCHALLGPHTVGNTNTDTCGDEDMPQAQGGNDASTEPPHSHVWLAEGQSSSARSFQVHPGAQSRGCCCSSCRALWLGARFFLRLSACRKQAKKRRFCCHKARTPWHAPRLGQRVHGHA